MTDFVSDKTDTVGSKASAWRGTLLSIVAVLVALAVVATTVQLASAQNVPNAPSGLSVTIEAGAVLLRWTQPAPNDGSPVVGYNIERNGEYYATVGIEPEFRDVATTAGQTYRYRVSAFAGMPENRTYGPGSEEMSLTVPTGPVSENLTPDPMNPSTPTPTTAPTATAPTATAPTSTPTPIPEEDLEAGPHRPLDLVAASVVGDGASRNPNGIRLTWNAGGGAPSIGFNISRDGEFIESVAHAFFVDCNVVAGQTYSYTVSAWSEGPFFSPSSNAVTATAAVTPRECLSLAQPGPGGPDGPLEDPIFDHVRDLSAKPASPVDVRIGAGRLQWIMPTGPRMLFQITRNGLTQPEGELWGQLVVTSGHPDLEYHELPDGRVQFSIAVDEFSWGDRFAIQAIHPWETAAAEGVRYSRSSRYATIPNPAGGQPVGTFMSSLASGNVPPGSWIGTADDWKQTAQFTDDFDGSGLLVDRPNPRWYFARSDGDSELTPSADRDQTQTDERAVLHDGKLEMSARIADGTYSYIGTANDDQFGYVVDPTNGVFIEASVRLDQMSPADNAWWAFWLMAPGADPCDADGNTVAGNWNAYDGDPRTGSEIDIFEFVPDLGNGFNQGLLRYQDMRRHSTCDRPDASKLSPYGRNFTYEGNVSIPGATVPNYTDGNYHRLGMYYAQDCYVFYMDDQLIWQVTEERNPGWVTPTARESIRLSWEIQNPHVNSLGVQVNNPWTSLGGNFANSAIAQDPTVYVDFVHVWEKNEAANGLCSGERDPVPQPDPEPAPKPAPLRQATIEVVAAAENDTQASSLLPVGSNGPALQAPVDVVAVAANGTISLSWSPVGLVPEGYDIQRDGVGYWTVTQPDFVDEHVPAGSSYSYVIVPWTTDVAGERLYGPHSHTTEVLALTVAAPERPSVEPPVLKRGTVAPWWSPDDGGALELEAPIGLVTVAENGAISLSWSPIGLAPDGYDVRRDGVGYWSVTQAEFVDEFVTAGSRYVYVIVPWTTTAAGERRYGPQSQAADAVAVGARTAARDVRADNDEPVCRSRRMAWRLRGMTFSAMAVVTAALCRLTSSMNS